MFGIEGRPVPKSELPGEVTSPTQPFPLTPAPLGRFGFKADELYKLTPEWIEVWGVPAPRTSAANK